MSDIGQYVYSVIVAAIFVSVLLIVAPEKGALRSMIGLAAGIFLVIAVLSPFVGLKTNELQNYFEDIDADAADIINDARLRTDEEIARVIKAETEAYISSKALEFGADVQVEIAIKQESPYTPESITIIGAVAPLMKQRLGSVLETDIGLSEESQKWILAQ